MMTRKLKFTCSALQKWVLQLIANFLGTCLVSNSLPLRGIITVDLLGSFHCIIFFFFFGSFHVIKRKNRINLLFILQLYIGREG